MVIRGGFPALEHDKSMIFTDGGGNSVEVVRQFAGAFAAGAFLCLVSCLGELAFCGDGSQRRKSDDI
jgi:hypothetical protein